MNQLNYYQFCKQNNYLSSDVLMSEAIANSSPSGKRSKRSLRSSSKILNIKLANVKEGSKAYSEYCSQFEPKDSFLAKIENLKAVANGMPELAATQAAKRLLIKYGIAQ